MANSQYSKIVIIYNPMSSSGRAQSRAERLAERLRRKANEPASVLPTDYPGHAEELAYQAALKYKSPLIISVSGDGGYNEVINGAMRAKNEAPSHQPVCAILAAGNANDHRRSVRKRPLSWAINHKQPESLALLRLNIDHAGHHEQRFAHSYIGLGVSSQAAHRLNQETYSRWQDVKIVTKTIIFFHPVKIIESNGKTQSYDSLVFMLVNHMSRVFRVGTKNELNSGYFRIFAATHRARLRQLFTVIRIIIFGVKRPPEETEYSFELPDTTLLHLDGEDIKLPAGAKVKVDVVADALQSLR